MFAKSDRGTSETAPVMTAANMVSDKASIISADLLVEGDLKSAGDIQVDGRVKGDIRSRGVTISPGAEIEGSIFAEAVVISGSIKGQVEAPKVSVRKNRQRQRRYPARDPGNRKRRPVSGRLPPSEGRPLGARALGVRARSPSE